MTSSLRQTQDKALANYQRFAFSQMIFAFLSFFGSIVSCFDETYSSGFCYGFIAYLRKLMFETTYGGNIAYNYLAYIVSSLLVSGLMGYLVHLALKAKVKFASIYVLLLTADFIFSLCLYGQIRTEAYITLVIFRSASFLLMVTSVIFYIYLYRLFKKKEGN